MRIVEIETFGHGGLAHYAHNLSLALADRGHEVTLVTTVNYELVDEDLPPNLRLVRMLARHSGWTPEVSQPASHLTRKVEAVTDAFAVAKLCRTMKADVLHLHCTNPIAALYVSRLRRLGVPLVYTAHVVTPHESVRFEKPIYRRLYRGCDLVISHSEFDRVRLREEFGLDRVTVIPHGDYGFFQPEGEVADRDAERREFDIAPGERVALFFGYIREYKGLDVLLEAWPKVVARCPAARLVIVGDPVQLSAERRRELQQQADRLGAIHRFEYIPFSEVSRYFALADALVMPYRRISQSGVLFLALALGVPVVASNVGALREMLVDGETAVLVPPEAPTDLAVALQRVLSDEAFASNLGEAGKALAAEYSWPSIAASTEAAFTELA